VGGNTGLGTKEGKLGGWVGIQGWALSRVSWVVGGNTGLGTKMILYLTWRGLEVIERLLEVG
jgi:hypothetical protein